MNCHWAKDPETEIMCFIPGCYGAIHDPAYCTCEIEGSRLDKAEIALARAEETIIYLRDVLKSEQSARRSLRHNNDRLRDEIRELRQLPPRK